MSILYFKFVFPSFDYEYHLGEIVKKGGARSARGKGCGPTPMKRTMNRERAVCPTPHCYDHSGEDFAPDPIFFYRNGWTMRPPK